MQAEADVKACLAGASIGYAITVANGTAPFAFHCELYVNGASASSFDWTDSTGLSVTAPSAGVYSMRFSVTDGNGDTAEAAAPDVSVFEPIAISLTPDQTGLGSVLLTWEDTAGDAASVQYSVETAEAADGEFAAAAEGLTARELTLDNLEPGCTRFFRVRAAVTETLPDGDTFLYETVSESVGCTLLESDFSYILQDGGYTITRAAHWDGDTSTAMVFPAEIAGLPVTAIGTRVLASPASVTSVTLPDSVTAIGDMAFYGSSALTEVIMADSVTEVGEYAFAGCPALTDIALSDAITSIGDRAFLNDSALTEITLPAALTELGRRAFSGTGVTAFALPDNLTVLGAQALGEAVTQITTGENAVGFCAVNNILYTAGLTELVCIPESITFTTYTAPDALQGVRAHAFEGRTSLETVILPDGMTFIGDYAFNGCTALQSISGMQSLVTIGDYAFNGCALLPADTLGNMTALESVGDLAFYGCELLQSAIFPDTFAALGAYAFYNCTALTTVRLGSCMDFIGDYAFYGCAALESITMPESVTEVEDFGSYLFYGCSSLTAATVPSGIRNLDSYCFEGCSALAGVTLPEGLLALNSRCFYGCSALTSVTLPESLLTIGYGAFFGCKQLAEINIPMTLTEIDDYAFTNCYKLPSLTLPACPVGAYAFGACRAMTGVEFVGDTPFTIGARAFYACSRLAKVTLPDSVTAIDASAFENSSNVTLYVSEGSVGHAFAVENEIPWQIVSAQ